MTDYTDDTIVWPLALRLAECLCTAIRNRNLPEPCFCGVIPGEQVTLDYCTDCDSTGCGMAWVRVAGVAPRQVSFAQPVRATASTSGGCQVAVEAVFEVGIVRCAPMLGPDGQPPSLAAQLDATRLQMADMAAGLEAAACCFRDRDSQVGGWTPLGPQGGCLGGTWFVTVGEV